MPLWIFLLFVLLPLAEVVLLVWIGSQIGFWYTAGIVLATGLLGAVLAREQGPRAWREIVLAWQEGRVPGHELVAGALFLVGAAFLLTPGVITDLTGFLLMFPGVRRTGAKAVVRLFRRHAAKGESFVVRVRTV